MRGKLPGEPGEETPKYKLPQGFRKSQELFNIDRAVKEPADTPLVIVEGFFDAIKLHQHGCRKVVALMGTTLSAGQEELIRQHTDSRSQVIVMLDENEAGQTGRDDIACRLSKFCFVRVYVRETRHGTGTLVGRRSAAIPWRRPMKHYSGRREGQAVIVTVDGRRLNPRFDLWNHSPTGFEWGYGGQQLSAQREIVGSLAILADHLGNNEQALNQSTNASNGSVVAQGVATPRMDIDERERHESQALQAIRQRRGHGIAGGVS